MTTPINRNNHVPLKMELSQELGRRNFSCRTPDNDAVERRLARPTAGSLANPEVDIKKE